VSRRVVVFGSNSGLAIWGPSLVNIPGFDAECVPGPSSARSTLRLPFVNLLREVRRASSGADAVIVVSALLAACVAATENRTPVVAIDVGAARLAETHQRLGRWPMAILLGLPTVIVGVTAAHAAALSAIGSGSGRVAVVRQPARPPACSWRPNRSSPYVVSVGRSGRDLGLLSAAAVGLPFDVRIVEGGRELVPGPGTKLPDPLPSNVKRHGRVTWDTYLRLLEGASAVVLPLRYSDYPVGVTVLLDAMAAGIPVVATAVPSVTEYQAEATAFTVPVGDATALARTLLMVVEDRDQAASVAETGRRHLEAIAAPSVVAARFATVLGEMH
jgi:glycosyltransferase involved in cell wall biosynthesis